jgi:sterol desaturase/sphingolipid hydroxylase (fatty acid hydroxylase superfamily)
LIRLAFALLLLLLLLGLERRWPWRAPLATPRRSNNLGLAVIDAALLRALAGIAPVAVASFAAGHGLGLFNSIEIPIWLEVLLLLLALDALVWWQHRWLHLSPLLWRLHRVHHSDELLDATSALRFHPAEIGASLLWKSLWVLLLGAAPVAVVVFEVLLNAAALITHANIAVPPRWEHWLGYVFITPGVHRVHHSVAYADNHSNFGTLFSLWDRLAGSYRPPAEAAAERLELGLPEVTGPRVWSLPLLLREPWQG